MKKVEMMKKAIKDSELNGYKWIAKSNGLIWDYLNTLFTFTYENNVVKFEDLNSGCKATVCVIKDESEKWLCDSYHDFCETVDEAIYYCAKRIIKKANYLY